LHIYIYIYIDAAYILYIYFHFYLLLISFRYKFATAYIFLYRILLLFIFMSRFGFIYIYRNSYIFCINFITKWRKNGFICNHCNKFELNWYTSNAISEQFLSKASNVNSILIKNLEYFLNLNYIWSKLLLYT